MTSTLERSPDHQLLMLPSPKQLMIIPETTISQLKTEKARTGSSMSKTKSLKRIIFARQAQLQAFSVTRLSAWCAERWRRTTTMTCGSCPMALPTTRSRWSSPRASPTCRLTRAPIKPSKSCTPSKTQKSSFFKELLTLLSPLLVWSWLPLPHLLLFDELLET